MTDTWWVPGLLNDPEEEKRRAAAASGLLSEGQGTRLYSPNPNAPTVYGAAPEPQQRSLTQAMSERTPPPFNALWGSLPPTARSAYRSLAEVLAELSPGAAVRDSVDTSRDTAEAVQRGDVWGSLGGTAGMLTAAAGVLPGGRLITKGAKELAQPIRAYHGSPHSFDKFDMSKIGTGEGAQAYGHGLYFAENEGVAKGYRDTLTKSASEWGQRALSKSGGDVNAAIAEIQGKIDRYTAGGAQTYADAQAETLRALQQYKQSGQWSTGSMYEVNIHADPARFLDWDSTPTGHTADMLQGIYPTNLPGSDIYQIMMHDVRNTAIARGDNAATTLPATQARTAEDLRALGIPGIRYLDQGSRSTGEGSRNYVVFDDKLIEILRKYGLLPVAGGAVAGASALPDGEDNSR